MQIDYVYDASVANAPAYFKTELNSAATLLDAAVSNNITVTIEVGWGEDAGSPIPAGTESTGGPQQAGIGMTYGQLWAAAVANNDQALLADMPSTDPTNGGMFYISAAQQQAWGLLPANGVVNGSQIIDGNIGFSSAIDWSTSVSDRGAVGTQDLVGDAEAEISHALGRIVGDQQAAAGWYTPFDLLRFASPGVQQLAVGQPAYISLNDGTTSMGTLNTSGDPSDWASLTDAFGNGWAGTGTTSMSLSQNDENVMGALGFNMVPLTSQVSMATGETVHASLNSSYNATSATGIAFMGTATLPNSEDNMYLSGNNNQITMSNAQWTNVYDLGAGLRLALNASTNISVSDFQFDSKGQINLYNTGYKNQADMVAHEAVYTTGTTGTLFMTPNAHGSPVLNLVGDTNVGHNQVVFRS